MMYLLIGFKMEFHWLITFLLGMFADIVRSIVAPQTTEWINRHIPFTRKSINSADNLHYLRTLKAIDDAGLDRSVVDHIEKDAEAFKNTIEYLTMAKVDAEVEYVSTATTQMEMNFEAKARAEAAERKLNKTLTELRKKSSFQPNQEKLKHSQENWERYRDSEAEFAASEYEGGSIAPLVYWLSYLQSTIARRAELLPLFEDK